MFSENRYPLFGIMQGRILEPMDRISEVLFGLIMVLTYTGSLSVATADRVQTRTMLIGALGCNLAWGIIDAGMYLIARLHERRRNIMLLHALRESADANAARRIVANVVPSPVTEVLSPQQLELLRQQSHRAPAPHGHFPLTGADARGALAVFLLVFLTTLPVAVPFILIGDARLALRLSNAIAIVMLFLCGYAFGRHAGMRPWATGIAMVGVGLVLVALTISLGG